MIKLSQSQGLHGAHRRLGEYDLMNTVKQQKQKAKNKANEQQAL